MQSAFSDAHLDFLRAAAGYLGLLSARLAQAAAHRSQADDA